MKTTVNGKTKRMMEEEVRLGGPLEDILPKTIKEEGSLEAAGKKLGISQNTYYYWMIRLGYYRVTDVRWDKKPEGS